VKLQLPPSCRLYCNYHLLAKSQPPKLGPGRTRITWMALVGQPVHKTSMANFILQFASVGFIAAVHKSVIMPGSHLLGSAHILSMLYAGVFPEVMALCSY
jgi:hypothetical protein